MSGPQCIKVSKEFRGARACLPSPRSAPASDKVRKGGFNSVRSILFASLAILIIDPRMSADSEAAAQ